MAEAENHLPGGTSVWKFRPCSLKRGGAGEMQAVEPFCGTRLQERERGERGEQKSRLQTAGQGPCLRDRRRRGHEGTKE